MSESSSKPNVSAITMEDVEMVERYKALTNELEAKAEILVAILKEKDYQLQKLRQQYQEILQTLEEREKQVVDLESELVTASESGKDVDQFLLGKTDQDSEKRSSFYRQEIEEKDKKIEKLTVELKKCTCYLQEIVNKELWAKNIEIEKLHNKQANSPEMSKLKKELSVKDSQLNVLKSKISELGVEIDIPPEFYANYQEFSTSYNINYIKNLQEQLENCKAEKNYLAEKLEEYESSNLNELIKELRSKYETLQDDFLTSERLRENSQEICLHLSTRLEELAIFLDSLLKQKSVLGFLGVHKERKLREIVNNSLDLSKSFSVSMIINLNQSLTQLSDISKLLNESTFRDLIVEKPKEEPSEDQSLLTIVPSNITLSYQSHLYKADRDSQVNSDQVINALREQIINLKSELQLRDNELSKFDKVKEITDNETETDDLYIKETSPTVKEFPNLIVPFINTEYHSESEAWSEPDMNVSRERIGLKRTIPVTQSVMESTENESLNSTTSTRKTSEKRFNFSELHHQMLNLQEDLKMKTHNLRLAEQDLEKMRNFEARFNETKSKLNYTESKLESVENDIQVFNKQIEELEQTKRELEEKIVIKDDEMQNKIKQLEFEKTQTSKLAEEFENEVAKGKVVIKELEQKVQSMRTERAEIEEIIRKEYDEITSTKMRNVEEQFMEKLNEIEAKAEAKFKEFKEEYSQDYIRRSDVAEKLEELVKLQKEITAFKSVVRSYEKKIDDYDAKEREFEYKIQEYQDNIIFLRKEVDSITLQFSEALLEKTKLINEKTSLEQEVNKYRFGGNQLKRQVEDIRTDFERSNIGCQKQIKYLQKCESELEMKVTQLESANAELRNKLVRLQVTTNDFKCSMPELGNKTVQILPYKRHFSEQTSTSEEVLDGCNNHSPVIHTNLQAAGDIERREANSSPDLGIESDQGRFSSLEIQDVPRPLLQTLELTESMNNLLSGEENISSGSATCENEHCCQKTLEVIYENNNLKRKIQNLGKALQDTIHQLNLANQRKKQVEKTICNQIHKTSQVLRQAKANLDSGTETELKP